MTSRYGDPAEWNALREEWYRRHEIGLKLHGAFEALFVTSAIKTVEPKDMDQIQEFLDHREFGLAFSLLTAILANQNVHLSDDAYAILENIGERMKIKPDDWHGLRRG